MLSVVKDPREPMLKADRVIKIMKSAERPFLGNVILKLVGSWEGKIGISFVKKELIGRVAK